MKIPKEYLEKIKVKDIMNTDIVRLKPYQDMRSIQEIMRIKRIDAIPIVDDIDRLVGLVTVENVIVALVNGDLNSPCGKYMVRDPKCLSPDNTLYEALIRFRQFRYGRFPVIDNEKKVLGMLSTKDVVLNLVDVEDIEGTITQEPKEENILTLEFPVLGGDFALAGMASSNIKKALQQLGISVDILRRVAVVTYEAEMNIVIHAYRGVLRVKVTPEYIEIIAEDEGPGIPDIELAMQPGYSTAPDNIREMGFGAGMGLPNIKNSSDELKIESEVGKGTKVYSKIYLKRERQ